jgi:hypothetical protein
MIDDTPEMFQIEQISAHDSDEPDVVTIFALATLVYGRPDVASRLRIRRGPGYDERPCWEIDLRWCGTWSRLTTRLGRREDALGEVRDNFYDKLVDERRELVADVAFAAPLLRDRRLPSNSWSQEESMRDRIAAIDAVLTPLLSAR